jgi:hypothetical protein
MKFPREHVEIIIVAAVIGFGFLAGLTLLFALAVVGL